MVVEFELCPSKRYENRHRMQSLMREIDAKLRTNAAVSPLSTSSLSQKTILLIRGRRPTLGRCWDPQRPQQTAFNVSCFISIQLGVRKTVKVPAKGTRQKRTGKKRGKPQENSKSITLSFFDPAVRVLHLITTLTYHKTTNPLNCSQLCPPGFIHQDSLRPANDTFPR